MAIITRTSDREREALRRSASAGDQGPNAQQQGGSYPRQRQLDMLGDPEDPTNVSFPFLRRMRRDHMVAMGLHFIAMPIVKAPWYYEADDARVAAFADNLIRPIFGRLVLTILRMLWAGYSPGVKNFEVITPTWSYYKDGERLPVWDEGGVGALVYKPVTPIRPENALPIWKDGKFAGISADGRYGGVGYFMLQGQRKTEVDLLHSLWASHDQESEDGCQPAGEMVLTTEGYVSIELLDTERHRLVSYNASQSKIHRGASTARRRRGSEGEVLEPGYSFEVFTRLHQGEMLTISAGGKQMRATPNHKLTVRWSEQAAEKWAVYIMRRGDDWRIGTTKLTHQKERQKNSGLGYRLWHERGDAAWVLETYDTKMEALFEEALWSAQYGVPDLCFKSTNHGLGQDGLDRFWSQVESASGARKLLEEHHRHPSFPLFKREEGVYSERQVGTYFRWTTHAANLMPGLMELPVDPGSGIRPDWCVLDVERDTFQGTVYSLQVEPYEHYVSGGIITRNSPFGFPRIAHCAPIFHMYRFMWTLLGRAFENNADPGPVVRYPREELPSLDADGKPIDNVKTALRIGSRRRSGSTVALPSDPYMDFQDKPTGKPKWDIEYPESKTDFASIQQFLGFLESAKLRSLWLQEQGLVEGSGGSSNRNVASEFGDQRDASQVVLMEQIIQIIDESFIKPALAMNMPWYEGTVRMKTIGFGAHEEEAVRQILQLAGQKDLSSFGVDVQQILKARNFPLLDPAEQTRLREEAAKAAQVQPTPEVTPTQGRRALVTQTGFDRETGQPVTAYHQLATPIELSADGDFISGLPRTEVFSDKQVVSAARALRKSSDEFLTWAYADFARYISKQRSLDLDEALEEIATEHFGETGEELAEGDRVRRLVDKLMGGWRPKAERITDFRTKSRAALSRAYDRTARVHLSRLSSVAKTSSTDTLAASFLDDQAGELISGVLETTRKQLAEVLAEGVREAKSTRQIAADIREHFDGISAVRAAAIARTEVSSAYNFATVQAGISAGVKKAQLIDGTKDEPCKSRNGRIVNLSDALKERLAHPNCTLFVRLLPRASANLDVRREPLDGLQARYDSDTETILLSPDISIEDEGTFLVALGDKFAVLPDEFALASQPQTP